MTVLGGLETWRGRAFYTLKDEKKLGRRKKKEEESPRSCLGGNRGMPREEKVEAINPPGSGEICR